MEPTHPVPPAGVAPRASWHVRPGAAGDAAQALALIRELAAYERAASEVTLTLERFARDAEAGRFAWTVAVLEGANRVIGLALHYPRYSTWKGATWYLEDLVVTEEWRGRGVGRALFEAVVLTAQARGAARLEWQVLDWNAPALAFYDRFGADMDGAWINGRLTDASMAAMNLQPSVHG